MTLIAYTGGAESNSYADLTWLEAYMVTIYGSPLSSDWTGLTTAQKEWCCEMACHMMGYLPLRGRRSYRYQGLPFPRTCQTDPAVVPTEVKQAEAMLAYEIAAPSMAQELSSIGTVPSGNISGLTIGPLTVNFATSTSGYYGIMTRLLKSGHPQIYLKLKKFISQIRGPKMRTESERYLDDATLLTTTTV